MGAGASSSSRPQANDPPVGNGGAPPSSATQQYSAVSALSDDQLMAAWRKTLVGAIVPICSQAWCLLVLP
jgi:hypothetical protein